MPTDVNELDELNVNVNELNVFLKCQLNRSLNLKKKTKLIE